MDAELRFIEGFQIEHMMLALKAIIRKHFGVSVDEPTRKSGAPFSKMAYAMILVEFKIASFESIGGSMNRIHSTISHYKKIFPWEMAHNPIFKKRYLVCRHFFKRYCDEELKVNLDFEMIDKELTIFFDIIKTQIPYGKEKAFMDGVILLLEQIDTSYDRDPSV